MGLSLTHAFYIRPVLTLVCVVPNLQKLAVVKSQFTETP